MKVNEKTEAIVMFLVVCLVIAVIGLLMAADYYKCHSVYFDHKPQWRIPGGCMVQDSTGKYVPIKNFRAL